MPAGTLPVILALASSSTQGMVLDEILNCIHRDQGAVGIDTDNALTIPPGGSLGQTFITGDSVEVLYRVVIWQAFWHETWSPDEVLVLTLWDSPRKETVLGRGEVPYDRRMFESAFTMLRLEAAVEPNREYYLELTVELAPLRPAELPTDWILSRQRPGLAGGDRSLGGIGRAREDYAAGRAYTNGEPQDFDLWFETDVRATLNRDALYEEAFARFDLDYAPLAEVKAAVGAREWDRACAALTAHFESRADLFPKAAARDAGYDTLEADLACEHRVLMSDGATVDLGPDWNHATLWPERGGVGLTRSGLRKPLAGAYGATGNPKYARAFNDMLRWFFINHPSPLRAGAHSQGETIPAALPPGLPGGSMWSGLAIGARMGHGFYYYGAFEDSPWFTPDVRAAFIIDLGEMADVLERMKGGGNWEAQMADSLLDFGLQYPEFRGAPKWVAQGFGTLIANALETVRPDGCLQEPAIGYHGMCMRRYASLIRRSQALGLTVPPEMRALAERMYEFVMYSTLPDGTLPPWGDAFPPLRPDDLAADAALFERPDFLFVGSRGKEGTPPTETSRAFPDGGFFYMRSGWGPDDHYLAVRCGPFGSHGHHDALSVILAPFGDLRIFDPGVYTYGTPETREISATRSHNTVTLDDADSSSGSVDVWSSTPELDDFVGHNDSYEGIDGAVHHRRVVFAKPREGKPALIVLFDDVLGEGSHTLASRFRLNTSTVGAEQGLLRAWTTEPRGNVLVQALGDGLTMDVSDGIAVRPDGQFGTVPVLRYSVDTALPYSLVTVIVPFRGVSPPDVRTELLQVGAQGARAVRVELPGDDGRRRVVTVAVPPVGDATGRAGVAWDE